MVVILNNFYERRRLGGGVSLSVVSVEEFTLVSGLENHLKTSVFI